MRPLSRFPAAPRSHRSICGRARTGCAGMLALLLASTAAHAQMVPKASHAYRQSRTGDLTEARISWQTVGLPATLTARDADGPDLDGQRLLRQWEGRVGALIDRPADPMRDHLGASLSVAPGLRLRSLHLLTDYYVAGGLRATAGLVAGETAQAWWGAGERGGGLNLSLQRVEGPAAGLEGSPNTPRTAPYVGAGYSTRLTLPGSPTAWQLNADVGVTPRATGHDTVLTRATDTDGAQRLRHVVKVSLGYAF